MTGRLPAAVRRLLAPGRGRRAAGPGRRAGIRGGRAAAVRSWRATVGRRVAAARLGDDSGQVLVLTLGLATLALALVLVVASATAVHLERKRLLALADLAALSAATAVADEAYYGLATAVPGDGLVSDASVRAAVEAYVGDHADEAARWRELGVVTADTPDGRAVDVELVAVVRLPFVGPLLTPWSDGVTIRAASSARAS